jgi:thiol-disulfide isomerase/thioredoxin
MKNIIALLLIFACCGCIDRNRMITGLEGKPMPSFDLLLNDSATHLNTTTIPEGKPIVLLSFGPDCPFCKAEMKDIVDNYQQLQGIRFYVFTSAHFRDMQRFYAYCGLQQQKSIVVGIDTANFFSGYYGAPGVPYMAIYDPKKKLKCTLLGKTSIHRIKDIAFE